MMKKTQFAFALFLFTVLLHAQEANNGFLLAGSVIYEEMIKMDIQLEGMDAQMAAQIPKERTSEKVLHFSEEASLFENHQKEDVEEIISKEGRGIVIELHEPDNLTYTDLKNGMLIRQTEFMSRVFLIESELKTEKWKLTGKQLSILDYACQEAIAEVDGKDVHAWFTSQIAVGAGPGPYSQLPGLVLAVEVNDGDRTLMATSVDIKPLDKSVLKKPTKGKKVSPEEFETIVAEKMKEMGAEGDGLGAGNAHTVVIKISQ